MNIIDGKVQKMRTVDPGMEVMLETFIHETETMLGQLDEILLESERAKNLSDEHINNIFRITHTIKGSAAMMDFEGISNLSHSVEDVFYVLRDQPEKLELVFDTLFDLILSTSDYLKFEVDKIQQDDEYSETDYSFVIDKLHALASLLKNGDPNASTSDNASDDASSLDSWSEDLHQIRVYFEADCQMENMRAFMLLSQLQHCCDRLESIPAHPENDGDLCNEIIENGFLILCQPSSSIDEVLKLIDDSLNIKSYELLEAPTPTTQEVASESPLVILEKAEVEPAARGTITGAPQIVKTSGAKQSLISVNQSKLDHLMDLVGELVTAESMVISNPDLKGLKLDNFTKSIRELRKLTDELQDIVMSIRMVPLSGTFTKMERIIRDMCKKMDKQAQLVTAGGDTEVDKTINDTIVDPFMHMIRNSMDHAIETPQERIDMGKSPVGRITLTARNVGGEIHIQLSDDGKGLHREKLLQKAVKNGLLTKPENEYTDKEVFGLIFLPGFSTNTNVTEYSGRGVGMDVVRKNIEQVGGNISISSEYGVGTTFTIKIPLTLAIVDGMNISVGNTIFTLPITSITQLFKVSNPNQIIENSDGSEMIMIRGECLPIIRLHDHFNIESKTQSITEGILIQVEGNSSNACIFADELLGEYQVVVKPFPAFFNHYDLKSQGLSGCSILGDGSISLILDTNGLLHS